MDFYGILTSLSSSLVQPRGDFHSGKVRGFPSTPHELFPLEPELGVNKAGCLSFNDSVVLLFVGHSLQDLEPHKSASSFAVYSLLSA